MFKKLGICLLMFGLILGVGFNQNHVYAAESNGIVGLLGGLFKPASPTPTAAYAAEDFKNTVADTMQNNPAKFDANFKGKGFLVNGEVEKIGSIQTNNKSSYYVVSLKGDLVCIFDSSKARELANLSPGDQVAIVGRANVTMTKDVLTVMLYDCHVATDKDKEATKK